MFVIAMTVKGQMIVAPVLAALAVATSAQAAAPPLLTEPAVRAFVARQEAAWNAKDPAAFAATFAPDARFTDQARGSDNKIVPYGSSTLAEATAQARRFFARSSFHATATVDRVEISPDGAQARVLGHETTRIETPGKPPRTLCAETEQRVIVVSGRLLSRGQTETAVRCPHAR